MNVKLKLSPPWITYINKLEALFDGDPQIAFNIDASVPAVTISTNNGDKAAALIRLLPSEVQFGGVTLKIDIDGPISNLAFETNSDLFTTAFSGNPAFVECYAPSAEGYWYPPITYVVFKNYVVQFFNDNLLDARGLLSTLYQDIANELFADAQLASGCVGYCTDVEHGKLGKPLGEWP
jgi:hypothetical protein